MSDTTTQYELRAAGVPEGLAQRARVDPLVHAHIRAHLHGGMPLPDMLVQLVIALSNANETLRSELVRVHMMLPPARLISSASAELSQATADGKRG